MMDLTKFDTSCLFECTNGQVSTTRNEPSLANRLCINVEETIEYASTLRTTLRGYSLIKCPQACWMTFDANWTSCTDLAEFNHSPVHTERVAG